MPDQIVTDKGSEFQICAFVAFMLASVYAHNRQSTRAPQRCVPSKRNVCTSHPPTTHPSCTPVMTHRPLPFPSS